jgi:hypothetical protein
VLRGRLEQLQRERQTIALIKASYEIRLPDAVEEQVAVRIAQRLGRVLPASDAAGSGAG